MNRCTRLRSPGAWVLLAALLAAPRAARSDHKVTVTLVGGAQISAVALRENDQGVVLDLGFEVLNLPRSAVLDVRQEEAGPQAEGLADQGVFTTGRLEPADVPELVARYGDSVVMIKTAVGLGTGFLVSSQGHLVTNYHVVENETRLVVTLFRRTEGGYEKQELKRVRILALQPLRDIALLQLSTDEVEGALPRALVINDRDDLQVGDLVFAVGNPLGLERTVTQGIVSSTTRTIEHLRLIQTDASINPGNSGGPLFNARGEVVGVVCAGHTSFAGLAFGIPATELIDFLRHRESYLYDAAQPQNGITYLDPPFTEAAPSTATAAEPSAEPAANPSEQP